MKQAIYGLGRFGTFWASVINQAGEVYGYNRSPRPLHDFIKPITLEDLSSCDVIWLCSAISSISSVSTEIAPFLKPGALVIDTCSVKEKPVAAMLEHLPDHVSIMGSHPMFGPDSAKNGLKGLSMVLSSVRNTQAQMNHWREYFESKEIVIYHMTPAEHDREAAITQGLTHLVGRILKELDLKESPIATLGFKKLKEVMDQTCNDPWQLFVELQHENAQGQKMRADFKKAVENVWQKAKFIDSN